METKEDLSLDNFRKKWKNELSKKHRGVNERRLHTKADLSESDKSVNAIVSDDYKGHEIVCVGTSKDEKETASKRNIDDGYFSCRSPISPDANSEGEGSSYHKTESSCDKLHESRKEPTLQPFLIAQNLLQGMSGKDSLADDTSKRTVTSTVTTLQSTSSNSSHNSAPTEKQIFNKKRKISFDLHDEENQNKKKRIGRESFLDIFLTDLNEINEIPFFDLSLPREVAMVIFKHLNHVDLCRCAQVSKAWKSLAEDELLWCQICQMLDFEDNVATVDKDNWKEIARQHFNQQHNLTLNWKNRVGKSQHLQYVSGGVLCAADSCGALVVSGYNNGDVKLWDLEDGDECTFQPSVTALVLDLHNDHGTVPNYVRCVAVNENYTVAGYNQGTVDIWQNEGGTDSSRSFTCPDPVECVRLARNDDLLAVTYRQSLRIETLQPDFPFRDTVDLGQKVLDFKLLPRVGSSTTDCSHVVVIGMEEEVKVHIPGNNPDYMTTLHHTIGQKVSCLDGNVTHVGFGLADLTGFDYYKVKLCCLNSGKEIATYRGHTWEITALNIWDSPPNMFVSGSGDKRVRVYDTRVGQPVSTLRGHTSTVCRVQMDDWKVVSGGKEGLVCVWDQRMATKLWELHNRHAVRYLHFNKNLMVTANIPQDPFPSSDDFDNMVHKRHRGALQAYNFSLDQNTADVPTICRSSYDEPESYSYGVRLAVPYDKI